MTIQSTTTVAAASSSSFVREVSRQPKKYRPSLAPIEEVPTPVGNSAQARVASHSGSISQTLNSNSSSSNTASSAAEVCVQQNVQQFDPNQPDLAVKLLEYLHRQNPNQPHLSGGASDEITLLFWEFAFAVKS